MLKLTKPQQGFIKQTAMFIWVTVTPSPWPVVSNAITVVMIPQNKI